jgi:GNAT superfamily N-acetyltransferase
VVGCLLGAALAEVEAAGWIKVFADIPNLDAGTPPERELYVGIPCPPGAMSLAAWRAKSSASPTSASNPPKRLPPRAHLVPSSLAVEAAVRTCSVRAGLVGHDVVVEYTADEARPRRAVPADAEQVASLWLRSRRASLAEIPPPVHTDDEVRRWFATVVSRQRETWVVEVRGAVAAVLVLLPGWIDQLYVDPDHTGCGLGTRLLEVAKALNPEGLDLWTFESNEGARRFYERHGFAAVAATDGDNEEGMPDVRYHWPDC